MPPHLPQDVAAAIASGRAVSSPDGWFIADEAGPRVTAARPIQAGTVLIFPHACPPAPRPVWAAALAEPGPARAAVEATAVALPGDDSTPTHAVLDGDDPLLARLWAWLRPSSTWAGSAARPLPAWFLEPRCLAWARHAEAPTIAVYELEPGAFPGALPPAGGSAAVALADLAPGDEVCRDLALRRPPAGGHSLASAAELVGRLPPRRFVHAAEREALGSAVAAAVAAGPPPGVGQAPRTAGDPLDPPPPLADDAPVTVWTDYPVFGAWLDGQRGGGGAFVRTADRAAADVVLTPHPVRDFLVGADLRPGQRVNQFPFEAALVRKDLLPQTLRAHQSRTSSGAAGGAASAHPPFFPPAFDLATEAAWALDHHARALQAGGAPPAWALKPASAARSVGVCGTASAATLAAFRGAGGAASSADFVAQVAVAKPWTVDGRKADLRVCVVVRAFGPSPCAFLYTGYHARVARGPLPPGGLGAALISPSFSTVSCYDDDDDTPAEEGSTRDDFLPRSDVDAALAASGADPAVVQASIVAVAREVVLAGAAAIGGPWPRSAAVYGLDVMLAEEEGGGSGGGGGQQARLHPRLLEVNFCPDPAAMTRFRPSLPGELLARMFGAGGAGGGSEVFVDLFP